VRRGSKQCVPPKEPKLRRNPYALSPRQIETLRHLLAGESEKEIASALGITQSTVHVYVKELHKIFGVCTRAELLSKFLPDLRGPILVELIEGGQLYKQRASASDEVKAQGLAG